MSDTDDPVKPGSFARLTTSASLFLEAAAERLGLNPTDLRGLQLTVAEPGLTASRLAELSGLTTGAVTGVLDRLERGGLVVRVADPDDRRRILVRALPKGEAVVSGLADVLARGLGALMDPLDAREASAVRRFVEGVPDLLDMEAARMRAAIHGAVVAEMFSAPLEGATLGRLRLVSGAPRFSLRAAPLGPSAEARMVAELAHSEVTIVSGSDAGTLCQATFEGPLPEVRASDGVLEVRYKRRLDWRGRSAWLGLSSEIPWSLDLSGGFSSVSADLQASALQSMDLSGGVDRMRLRLPVPQGIVQVRIRGSSADVTMMLPAGVAARLSLSGGARQVRFIGQAMHLVHGSLRMETRDSGDARDRYEIEMSGGVRDLNVTRG